MIGTAWGIEGRSIVGFEDPETSPRVIDLKAVVAEFVAMTLFIIIGCGTACTNGAFDGATRLLVAFAFGMAIMVLAYSVGHHSGGHINGAVTFSLVLGGQVSWYQGIANVLAQLLGSVLGSALLLIFIPCDVDMTTTLGTNIINHQEFNYGRAVVAEIFGTFLLCFTVWETAVTPQASCGKNACIAIGFSVFLAHLFLLPIDGCSINPTRSFGPAIISKWRNCSNYTEGGLRDLWVMWVGPLIGGLIAALVQRPFAPSKEKLAQMSFLENQAGIEGLSNLSIDKASAMEYSKEKAEPADAFELGFDDESLASSDKPQRPAPRQWHTCIGRCMPGM